MSTFSKLSKLESLFQTAFKFESLRILKKLNIADFHCSNCNQCNVDVSFEPIYTPFIGDENTKIMIIGEAPSRSGENGGGGPYIGGEFKKLQYSGKSPITEVREFVKENYGGTIPYFSDMIKCGVAKQNGKEAKLKLRTEKCIDKFLQEEIKIIEPNIIFCTGKFVYDNIFNKQQAGNIDGGVRIIKLVHYSRRPLLSLSTRDKRKVIWKIQANLISESELNKISILELSAVKKYFDEGSRQTSVDSHKQIPLKKIIKNKESSAKDSILYNFWEQLLEKAKEVTELHAHRPPGKRSWISTGAGKSGLAYCYSITKHESKVELYIDRGKESENKNIFDELVKNKDEIEKDFGESLKWERLDNKRACRISRQFDNGGYRDEDKWPNIHDNMIDAMCRFEKALKPYILKLKI